MKSELRKKYKSLRDNLTDRKKLDKKISDRFLRSDYYKEAETIMLYSSTGSEVSTEDILFACLKDKKKIAYPVCIDRNGNMKFCLVEGTDDLQEDMYGIYAPKPDCVPLCSDEKCLCCVPGLSFDKKGYRLGYGKGYYDRYLSDFPGVSVGLCYDSLVAEDLPSASYDKTVNYLISDKKIYKFNSKEDFKNG